MGLPYSVVICWKTDLMFTHTRARTQTTKMFGFITCSKKKGLWFEPLLQ